MRLRKLHLRGLTHFNPLNSLKDSRTKVAVELLVLLRSAAGTTRSYHSADNVDKPCEFALNHLYFSLVASAT